MSQDDKNERPFPLTLSDSGVMLLIEQAQARARVLGFHDETGTLLRRLAEQLLAARSADRSQEGYPGIAHDFETMRSALVQIRDECFNGHAHDIAEAALNAAPQAVSGDTEGGTGRTRGVIESDRRAGRPAALKSSDADLEPEDWPGRVERDRSIGPSPDSQPAVAAPTSSERTQEPVAWRREWDGDVSDEGQWVYADSRDELDEHGPWQPLYAAPSATSAQYDPVSGKCRGDCDCSIGQTCKAYLAYRAKAEGSGA